MMIISWSDDPRPCLRKRLLMIALSTMYVVDAFVMTTPFQIHCLLEAGERQD